MNALEFNSTESIRIFSVACFSSHNQILKIRLFIDDPHDYGSPPYVFVLLNQTSLLDALLVVPAAIPASREVFVFANIEFLLVPLVGTDTD